MPAPLRDYLRYFSATEEHYFTRFSVGLDPSGSGFAEARWSMRTLNVFTTRVTSGMLISRDTSLVQKAAPESMFCHDRYRTAPVPFDD